MQTKALVCDSPETFSIREVQLPDPGPRDLLLRTEYSGVSVGTEFACIQGKLDWGPHPLVTGYQAVGRVESAGEEFPGFKKGDRVFWRLNRDIRAVDGSKITGAMGAHCAHAVVPVEKAGEVGILPEGVPEDAAALFVMPAVGLYGVDMSQPRMGDLVVVAGCGLIGLGVVAAAAHRGCRVLAVDLSAERLRLARRMGARYALDAADADIEAEVRAVQQEGADVVFECTGLPAMIDKTIPLCRRLGKFVWQGNYGREPLNMLFLPPHGRRLTMFFPCDDGGMACRMAVLHNMVNGFLPWHETITHRVNPRQAAELYRRIGAGEARDLVGAVVCWTE